MASETSMAASLSVAADSFVICGFEGDPVAKSVASQLGKELLIIKGGRFNDTSSNVKLDLSNRSALENKTVCIIAGNCRKENKSINDTTMETFLAINAAKQAGAKEVNLYLPHLGYARQDKVSQAGEPLAAPAVLKMFELAGARKVTVLDIHNEAVFGGLSSNTTGINRFAMREFANRFKEMKERGVSLDNLVVVAPDKGARDRARRFQEAMKEAGFTDIAFAYFDKTRNFAVKGQVQTMDLRKVQLSTGEVLADDKAAGALKGKTVIVVDDMADTCGTMLLAISGNMVGRYEAKEAYAAITHGVFSGDALDKISRTKELAKLLVTDSIPLRGEAPDQLEIVSCAPVFAEAIAGSISG